MALPVPSALAQLALTPAYPGHEGYGIRISTIVDGQTLTVHGLVHHNDTEEIMQQRVPHMLSRLCGAAEHEAEGGNGRT